MIKLLRHRVPIPSHDIDENVVSLMKALLPDKSDACGAADGILRYRRARDRQRADAAMFMHPCIEMRQAAGLQPDIERRSGWGDNVKLNLFEQVADTCQMHVPGGSVYANPARHAGGGGRCAIRNIVAEQVEPLANGEEIVDPEKTVRRVQGPGNGDKTIDVMTKQAMKHEKASPRLTCGNAPERLGCGGVRCRTDEDPVQNNLQVRRLLRRGEGQTCDRRRKMAVNEAAANKFMFLVGDQNLSPADIVNISIVTDRNNKSTGGFQSAFQN